MDRIFFFFVSFVSFFPTFAWAQEVEITEVIECFGTAEDCAVAIDTYIRTNPNGGVRVEDGLHVGGDDGTTSRIVVDSGGAVRDAVSEVALEENSLDMAVAPPHGRSEPTPDRLNFLLLGSIGYLQVGELSGASASAGFGFDLQLSERGNIGLRIEILPAGVLVGAAVDTGQRFHTAGALSLLAGGEDIRAVLGYRAGWISSPRTGSAGQYHHGTVGVQFLAGEEGRWSLTPTFHAGWGITARAEGRSLGAGLSASVRF